MDPKIFSAVPGLGRVYQCPSCADLHMSIGPVDLRLPMEAFDGIVDLMNKAAREMHKKDVPADIARGVSWTQQPWSLC